MWAKAGVSGVNADTESFADFVARDSPATVLEIGTGTGYVAIRLALEGSIVTATDISPLAKDLAESNAARNKVSLQVVQCDLLAEVEGQFDAIVFNPPFSARPDRYLVALAKELVRRIGPLERTLMHHMPNRVATFRRSLIERFVTESLEHLAPSGSLYLLLYSEECLHLKAVCPRLVINTYSDSDTARRNLCFAKLSRSSSVGERS